MTFASNDDASHSLDMLDIDEKVLLVDVTTT
jgi:hypothetical protein